ncbi:hypothetical protein KUA19_41755 [Catellatospora sp. NEAU-YM18]|nr:hypothetical protein [Catellatospora tritici]
MTAVAGLLWAVVVGALLAPINGAFGDLNKWRWWLLGAAAVASAGIPVAEVMERRRSLRGRSDRWHVEKPDPRSIQRADLVVELVRLLTADGAGTVGVTTGLFGAGGFGKTTLARQVCQLKPVRKRFRAAVWVTVGEEPTEAYLLSQVGVVVEALSGQPLRATDLRQAGIELGRLLDEYPRTLLVVDDVWDAAHLRPFLQGGLGCTRLVTTRRKGVLPDGSQNRSVRVDEFDDAQARMVLTADLPPLGQRGWERLVELTGRWPLLVRLANRQLVTTVDGGATIEAAVTRLVAWLEEKGPASLDLANRTDRDQAAAACIGASVNVLDEQERRRFAELAVFGEDVRVPHEVLQLMWARTGGLSAIEVGLLCERLDGLSLLADFRRDDLSLRLHDVIRAYLRSLDTAAVKTANATLIDAGRPLTGTVAGAARTEWWRLPDQAGYWWSHLCEHLAEARADDELAALVCDLRWVETRLTRSGPLAVDADLALADDAVARVLRRAIRQNAHLLLGITPAHSLADNLAARLQDVPELQTAVREYRTTLPPAMRFVPHWPLPDQPHSALRHALTGHVNSVESCAVSPDGRFIVTGSWDGTARVWNAADGQPRHILTGHNGRVGTCAVSPDGRFIVTASDDGSARVWDAAAGQLLRELLGHTDSVVSCAVSPDGRFIVTASDDGSARVWDAAAGQLLRELLGHTDSVVSCAVSPDGRFIVTASDDGSARVWDAAAGQLLRELLGHTDSVVSCAVSPDGRFIVTASNDRSARVWDAAAGQLLHELLGHTGKVVSCAVSPDGRFIVTASWDDSARVWDVANGRLLHELLGHTDSVVSCAVSPDGRFIVTTSWDGSVRVWDASDGQPLQVLTGHAGWVMSCAVSPDGRFIVTTSDDDSARVWKTVVDRSQRHEMTGHADMVVSCAVSQDGRFIVTTSAVKSARVWDVADGQLRHTLLGHTGNVVSCAVSPDGRFIVTTSWDGSARVWDASDGQSLQVLTGHASWVVSCAVSHDGRFIVTAGWDDSVRVWDAADGQLLHELLGHTDKVVSCAVSPDSRFIVTTSDDRSARVWDAAAGQLLHELLGHTDKVVSCAVSPDSRFIVTASWDDSARVWDAANGRLLHELLGHTDKVVSCAVSPDDRFIVTTSWDDSARVWDAANGRLLHELLGHTDSVVSCAVSPDSRFIVTTSVDKSGRLWDSEAGRAIATIRANGTLVTGTYMRGEPLLCLAGPSGVYVLKLEGPPITSAPGSATVPPALTPTSHGSRLR